VPVLLLGCLRLIPAHRLAYRFMQRRRVIAKRLGVLAVIDDVGLVGDIDILLLLAAAREDR
jgi:hypothetical protein